MKPKPEKKKTLSIEDFQLTEEELARLVRGAQEFMPPLPDEDDDERQPTP